MATPEQKSKIIDLHSHTTCSDGVLSVQELVAEAQKRGLSALAITDHDGVRAIPEAQELTRSSSLEIVPGVEVSAALGEHSFHILGLFVNPNHSGLSNYLKTLSDSRYTRAEKIVQQLQSRNVPITFEEVLQAAKGAALGRMHVAFVLIKHGIVKSRQEAFMRYLIKGRPGFVPYERGSPSEAIHWIKEAGGLSFLAHPGLVRDQSNVVKSLDMGLNGLEVVHPEHSPSLTARYSKHFCDERGLLKSGGSDYHGPNLERKGDLGHMNVPHEYLVAMKERIRRGQTPESEFGV